MSACIFFISREGRKTMCTNVDYNLMRQCSERRFGFPLVKAKVTLSNQESKFCVCFVNKSNYEAEI